MLGKLSGRMRQLLTSTPVSGLDGDDNLDVRGIQFTLFNFGIVGFAFLALYSLYGASKLNGPEAWWLAKFLGLLGTLASVGFASFAMGGFLGFLFGIPKSNTAEESPDADQIKPTREWRPYLNNTNLEEMSDWLTKIIVGAGLVGLKDLATYFKSTMGSTASKLDGAPFATLIVTADFIGFAILGFFTIYLLTRLFLVGAFTRVETQRRSVREQAKRLANLDMDDMSDQEKVWLKKIIAEGEANNPLVLPPGFQKKSPDDRALQSLQNRLLVKPKVGDAFSPGDALILTPFAKAILAKLKQTAN